MGYPTISGLATSIDKTPKDVNINAVFAGIKEGRWKDEMDAIRAAYNAAGKSIEGKKAIKAMKEKLPAVIFSGHFSTGRKDHNVDSHSGVLCLDFDGLDGTLAAAREKLTSDPHVLALFLSPSGDGLKALVPIEADAARHVESFNDAEHYFKKTHALSPDPSGKNVARLCYVSYDPDMFSRASAEKIPKRPTDLFSELVKKCGPPYTSKGKGGFQINQMFFVARFAGEHLVLHEPNERDFYKYDERTGAWVTHTPDAIKAVMSDDWQRFAADAGEPGLLPLRTNGLLESFVSLLRGYVEKPEAFTRDGRIIHLQNGMLRLTNAGADLEDFSPGYYSRNVCPIPWDPDAQCPRFKSELLASALGPEDISLLQRWCGSLLLGRNLAQKIMLLTGTPGGGKSTLLEIIEAIIGPANVCQLRTEHLGDRFEISRFLRKTMLSGKDVKGNFLQTDGANVLKSLVGHDLLSAERKSSNSEFQLRGEFGVAVSCNSRLRVRLDGDVDAWRRRIMMVNYEKPKPPERILDFAKHLLAAEASGILRWMVDGAIIHLKECDSIGEYDLTEEQNGRVDRLLAESDSIRFFVVERIQASAGLDLTTSEIVSAYFDYCSEKGWVAFGTRDVERKLPDLMLELYRSSLGAHCERLSKRQRGYPNVALATLATAT